MASHLCWNGSRFKFDAVDHAEIDRNRMWRSLQIMGRFAGIMCSRCEGSQMLHKSNAKVPEVLVV